jgi:hypothetical protein
MVNVKVFSHHYKNAVLWMTGDSRQHAYAMLWKLLYTEKSHNDYLLDQYDKYLRQEAGKFQRTIHIVIKHN